MDDTMAARFTISDSDSEPPEEVEEEGNDQPAEGKVEPLRQRHALTLPELRSGHGRIRLNSESHASTISREEELQGRGGEEEAGTPTEGLPFRNRSNSAPPALWAAKKYGRQLRRMSDEFGSLLDKGELRKVSSAGTNRPIHHSRSWWNYLFSHQETEGESSHHENHAPRTE